MNRSYFVPSLIVIAFILFTGYLGSVVQASAPPGLPSSLRTATTTQVGPQETKTLFTSNTSCTSRIIRTQGVEIYLLFADPTNGDIASTTLTPTAGFFQGASTTIAYDGGIYGCGRVTAEASASTTITISEMQ